MPTQEYTVAAEDAAERVAQVLGRGDVSHVRIEDIDGETLVDVPGGADPEAVARQVLGAFGEYGGGGTTVRLVVQTVAPDEAAPPRDLILDEPPESPEAGEPLPHGGEPKV
jgi:hypothetical protein